MPENITSHGYGVVTVALRPETDWASSNQPHALIVVDWGEDHEPNAITFAGPLARAVLKEGPVAALALAREIGDDGEVFVEGEQVWDPAELTTLERALSAAIDEIPAAS